MKKKDRRQIAEIVETVLETERKQEIKRDSIIQNEKLIRRIIGMIL